MRGRGRGSPDDKSVVELSWESGKPSCGKVERGQHSKGDIVQYNERKVNVCTRNGNALACQWNFEV